MPRPPGGEQRLASMFELLRKHITRRVPLSPQEFEHCKRHFTPRRLRRGQFLLQEGEDGRYLSYVTRGCVRIYTIGDKGEEHVLQFAVEDWWASDLTSFLSGEPATYTLDALEESDLLMLERTAREELLREIPKMERFFRILLEARYIAANRRIVQTLSASAEERYRNFLKTYPALVQRIPQRHIASYLGITPQSLSRIRREMK